MSLLSLVITHYNEEWAVCEPLFQSIAMQLGIDFNDIEVIVAQDGDATTEYLEKLAHNDYPFKIALYTQKKKGVSSARNLGLLNSEGEYVMFCDCDDQFISVYGLYLMLKHTEAGFDCIKSPFVEDQIVDGELKLIRHEHDISFIHGKMWRKQFLLDNNLKFNEKLTIHEDGYFNVLANMMATKQHELQPAIYLWKYNDKSVVRRDRDLFIYKTYSNLMDCRIAICSELWDRGYINEFYQAVSKTVIDSYYDFQKPEAIDPNNKKIIEKAEKEFARFYKKYREFYNEVNINDIAQMMYLCRTTAFVNHLRVEQETISQFLTRIVTSYIV